MAKQLRSTTLCRMLSERPQVKHLPSRLSCLFPVRCPSSVSHCTVSYVGNTAGSLNYTLERCDMLVPRTRTELGRRSFPVAAPTIWNSLLAHLRSTLISRRQLRDGLKSHLFEDAYFWSSENIRYKSVMYLLTYLHSRSIPALLPAISVSLALHCIVFFCLVFFCCINVYCVASWFLVSWLQV